MLDIMHLGIFLKNATVIVRFDVCIALYLWTLWMYVGKHRFYKFFTVFTLVVYTFGFISFILVPLLNFQTICEIVLSGLDRKSVV